MKYTYINSRDSLTVFVAGNPYTVAVGSDNYDKVLNGIKDEISEDAMIKLLDYKESVITYIGDEFELYDGALFHNGKAINNYLTSKILQMKEDGFDINPMLNFLKNLQANPSFTAQEELLLFMEANDMPITPDGHFLSYKSVDKNYKDHHTHTFDNSIGSVCTMERKDVNDNRQITCSHGLHIGAKEYAGTFGFGSGSHLMIVKVNPRDVVSIPYDYNNQKGRVCRYEVIGEVNFTPSKKGDMYAETSVYDDGYSYAPEDAEYVTHKVIKGKAVAVFKATQCSNCGKRKTYYEKVDGVVTAICAKCGSVK